jgi:TPR repeat protein
LALAFDGPEKNAHDKTALQIFKNPRAALQAGLEDVRSGKPGLGLEALQYAAAGGEPLARWKLGKMYEQGDGVPHDDVKAYDYFSQIVDSYFAEGDQDNPNRRELSVVASAFVTVGLYSLTGITGKIEPDPARAREMFQYAATSFGDADAQYDLARMYLDGTGLAKDSRQAGRWLSLAADKGHMQAEALLGQMLFNGQEGVRPQRARGLMWLTLARDAAIKSTKDHWILDLYDEAIATAKDDERQIALGYLDDYLKKHN